MFDLEKMDDNFYLNFDTKFWINKSKIIKKLIDDEELKKQFDLDGDSHSEFLLKDLHMTKVHCCETLLRILIVTKKHPYQPLIPLISIRSQKFNSEIEKIVKIGLDRYWDSDDLFQNLFYPYDFKNNEEIEKLELSLNFIKTAVKLIAKDYLDHKYYNALKHGFYGTTISNFSLSVKRHESNEQDMQVGQSPKMLTWIGFESKETIVEYNSAFSVDREMNIIKITSAILNQLFLTQKSEIKKEDGITQFFTKKAFDNLNKLFQITEYGSSMLKFDAKITAKFSEALFKL